MKEAWQHNFERLRQAYKPVFDGLEAALGKLAVDFYLIGAQSRDVWMAHMDLESRVTADIDYCVYVPDRATWDALTQYLISERGFQRDDKLPYRFYIGPLMMDLIPYGGLQEKDGEVMLEDPKMELSVLGTKTILEDATVSLGNFRIVTLPGLCIMKLIAFSEKPDLRAKDWGDFLFLLNNYGEIAGNTLYEGTYDDLIEEDMELNVAAARMLGRQMAPILNKDRILREQIIAALTRKCDGFVRSEIDEMYLHREDADRLITNFKLIAEALQGIID